MSLLALFRQTYDTLPKRFRAKAVIACVLLIFQSLAELISLGSIIPAIPALMTPEVFFHHGIGAKIAALTGIDSPILLSLAVLGGVICLFVVKNIFVHFANRYQSSFVFDLFHDLATKLHRHYMEMGLLGLRSLPSPEIARDIIGVTQRFASNMLLAYLFLMTELVVIAMLSAGIMLYEPLAFFAVAITVLPPFGLFYLKIKRTAQGIDTRINELEAGLSTAVYQSLFGYVDVLSTGSQNFFLRRFAKNAGEYAHYMDRRTVLGLIPGRLVEISMVLGVTVLYLYANFQIPEFPDRLTLFGVYLVAAYRLLPSANRVTLCLLSIRGNSYSIETVRPVRDMEDFQTKIPPEPIEFKKQIIFEKVQFKYPGAENPTLKNINVTIRKGECIGIVGPSGTGKSTFLNLLLGFFEPTAGRVQIDDTTLSPRNIESWRKHLGYVQQEVFIVDGTIRENIAFGVEPEEMDLARIERGIELAALSEFVRSLPKNLDTPVGERGAALSVGQKQRIGIARALYHGAEIIVFDEATSALDAATEREITATINKIRSAGCTVVLVSHRESPLQSCDRILKVENGTLI